MVFSCIVVVVIVEILQRCYVTDLLAVFFLESETVKQLCGGVKPV